MRLLSFLRAWVADGGYEATLELTWRWRLSYEENREWYFRVWQVGPIRMTW